MQHSWATAVHSLPAICACCLLKLMTQECMVLQEDMAVTSLLEPQLLMNSGGCCCSCWRPPFLPSIFSSYVPLRTMLCLKLE